MSACIHGLTRCETCAEASRSNPVRLPERVRCRHGFPSEICPTCAGLGESNPLVSEETKALNKLSARHDKALAVVEAARQIDTTLGKTGYDPLSAFGALYNDWLNLKTALAAFDEAPHSHPAPRVLCPHCHGEFTLGDS